MLVIGGCLMMTSKSIGKLKNNTIPKGLVPLEELFDKNDIAKNPKVTPNEAKIEDCNIGTNQEPKIAKLSKSLSPKIKKIISD